jgi:hypothetical protein
VSSAYERERGVVEALGRHVGERADGGAGRGDGGVLVGAGDAEVGQVRRAGGGDQRVGRFDVAVDEALAVGGVECAGQLR